MISCEAEIADVGGWREKDWRKPAKWVNECGWGGIGFEKEGERKDGANLVGAMER